MCNNEVLRIHVADYKYVTTRKLNTVNSSIKQLYDAGILAREYRGVYTINL